MLDDYLFKFFDAMKNAKNMQKECKYKLSGGRSSYY